MESSLLKFRQADISEADLLSELALRSKSYWDYDQDYIEGCRDALRVNDEYISSWPVFIGEINQKVVGFFALKTADRENRLDHLWIEPENIGTGLGKQFFNLAVTEAKKMNWTKFRLAADPPAKGFYEKMGMKKIGDVQSRIKPDLFLPHMELNFS